MQNHCCSARRLAGASRCRALSPGERLLGRTHPTVRFALVFATAVGATCSSSSAQVDATVVQMVSSAILSNYSPIRTASLTMRETTTDAGTPRQGATEIQLPGGGSARVTSPPHATCLSRVWLADKSVRVDRMNPAAPASAQQTLVRHDGVWTQLSAEHNAAWRRRPAEMPSLFPIDPRDFGSQDASRSMLEVLAEDAVVESRLTQDASGMLGARVVLRNQRGAQATYWFDSRQAYLPTLVTTRWPDGSLLQQVEIAYRPVLDERALFPETLVRRFFARGAAAAPSDTGWRQEVRTEIVGDIELNEPLEEAVFTPEIPPGTSVRDNFRLAVYETPPLPTPERPLLLYATLVVTALLAAAVVLKRVRFAV